MESEMNKDKIITSSRAHALSEAARQIMLCEKSLAYFFACSIKAGSSEEEVSAFIAFCNALAESTSHNFYLLYGWKVDKPLGPFDLQKVCDAAIGKAKCIEQMKEAVVRYCNGDEDKEHTLYKEFDNVVDAGNVFATMLSDTTRWFLAD